MSSILSSPPLFIVINAGSGHGDMAAVHQTIQSVLNQAGRIFQMFLIEDVKRIDEVARQAVASAMACNGAVVAVGGDGTISTVANAVLESGCPFGVIPRGTFNYFGRVHAISEDAEEATRALLRAVPQPVQVGLVNGRLFLVNASLGLYPQLLEDREAYKKRYGRSRIVAFCSGLASVLRQHKQLRITLEQAGQASSLRTPTLFIGNNRLQMAQLGIPLTEAVEDGQLAAIAVRPVGIWSMLWLVIRGALGRLGDADNVINFSFKRLAVKPSSLYRARRVKVAVDGEVSWLNTPLEFCVSQQPLYLLKAAVDPNELAQNREDA